MIRLLAACIAMLLQAQPAVLWAAAPSRAGPALPGIERQGRSGNATTAPEWVSITRMGVRLTLSLPGRNFPAQALVRATVTLTNISRHAVPLEDDDCLHSNPRAAVLSVYGVELNPVLAMRVMSPPCPKPRQTSLRRGARVALHPWLVLAGPRVRADVDILSPKGRVTVHTAALSLRLYAAPAPALTMVHLIPGRVPYIRVSGAREGHGPLRFVTSEECGSPRFYHQALAWSVLSGSRIRSACEDVSTWHVMVGRQGGPVASLQLTGVHRAHSARMELRQGPAVHPCSGVGLAIRPTRAFGAAGTGETRYTLRNVSTAACTLDGYPRVRFLDRNFVPLPTGLHRGGIYPPHSHPHTVTLRPGGSVAFWLSSLDIPVQRPGDTVCRHVPYLLVFLPGASLPIVARTKEKGMSFRPCSSRAAVSFFQSQR